MVVRNYCKVTTKPFIYHADRAALMLNWSRFTHPLKWQHIGNTLIALATLRNRVEEKSSLNTWLYLLEVITPKWKALITKTISVLFWATCITERWLLCNAPIINFLTASLFEATIIERLYVLCLVSEVSLMTLFDVRSVAAKQTYPKLSTQFPHLAQESAKNGSPPIRIKAELSQGMEMWHAGFLFLNAQKKF